MRPDKYIEVSRVNLRGRFDQARLILIILAFCGASAVGAQMVSIPLGGPRPERPSPNATLLGAPAEIAAAVAEKGRPPAMRRLDDTYHPSEVLEFLGLSRGVRVLVVEHDPGYYGAIIGAAVDGGGRVVELIRPAAMQDPAIRALVSEGISLAPSLSLLATVPAEARLAPDSFDFVLLNFAIDHLLSGAADPGVRDADVGAFAGKLFAAVRRGGIVGIVDGARADDDRRDAMAENDAGSIKRAFASAGFLLDSEGRVRSGGNDENVRSVDHAGAPVAPRSFILRYRKPE
jgi:predicted methyltransferase